MRLPVSTVAQQECGEEESEHADAQVDDGRGGWQRELQGPRNRPAPVQPLRYRDVGIGRQPRS